MSDPSRVCPHGALRRSCYTCDLEERIDVLEKELAYRRRCGLLRRWHHSRLRRCDLEIYALFIAKAQTSLDARMAWDIYTSSQGQEHWRCECAGEIATMLAQALWRVDAKEGLEDDEPPQESQA